MPSWWLDSGQLCSLEATCQAALCGQQAAGAETASLDDVRCYLCCLVPLNPGTLWLVLDVSPVLLRTQIVV